MSAVQNGTEGLDFRYFVEDAKRYLKAASDAMEGREPDETALSTAYLAIRSLKRDAQRTASLPLIRLVQATEDVVTSIRFGKNPLTRERHDLLRTSFGYTEANLSLLLTEDEGIPDRTYSVLLTQLIHALARPTKDEEGRYGANRDVVDIPRARPGSAKPSGPSDLSARLGHVRRQAEVLMRDLGERICHNPSLRDALEQARQLYLNCSELTKVPVLELLEQYRPAIEDLSLRYGKPTRCLMDAGDIHIDQSLADLLREPLLCLIRLCFDQSLETPHQRSQSGKANPSCLILSAKRHLGLVKITVRDDGLGVRESAFTETLALLSECLEEMGGTLEISGDQGSCFTIAWTDETWIDHMLKLKAGGELLALPVSQVVEIRAVEPGQCSVHEGLMLFHHGHHNYRVLPPPRVNLSAPPNLVVLVRHGLGSFALAVDEVLGPELSRATPLVPPFVRDHILAMSLSSDGHIVSVLNTDSLAKQHLVPSSTDLQPDANQTVHETSSNEVSPLSSTASRPGDT